MALAARALAYGQEVDYLGPQFKSADFSNGKVVAHFSHAASGLKIGGEEKVLNGFEICGEDRQFHPANATITDGTVEISSPAIPRPMGVEFGWTNLNHDANLVNSEQLPANPFRCFSGQGTKG